MGLFHAYLKYIDFYGGAHQQLITFVNREVSDEWWRMISTPPSIYAGYIQRVSPQFYFQNKEGHSVVECLGNHPMPNASQFLGKMYFVYAPEPMFSPQFEITDHISGRWYFVRSKADPFSHWYLCTSGVCLVCGDTNCDAIHVSSEYRTRFRVQVRNDAQIPENFVVIGSDEVLITAPRGYTLYVNDVGDLKAMKGYQGETDLLFNDLQERFIARAEKKVNGEVWEYIDSVERGMGEVWELVK